MSFNTHNIYHPLIVNSGWTSQSISATTISAGTFYGGSLSATYVGNQNVTNQEFIYLSGVTSNVQNQINELPSKSEPFITHSQSSFLTNEIILTATSGVNIFTTTSNVSLESYLSSLEFSSITVSFNSSQTAITDWNPTNFQVNDNVRATNIIISGVATSMYPSIISGLSGGTNGRVVIITNLSNQLYILENKSTKCNLLNRFSFVNDSAYFLGMKNKSVILIYNTFNNLWEEYSNDKGNSYFSVFQDFNCKPRQFMSIRDPLSSSSSKSATGCPPFYFKYGGAVTLPISTGFTNAETCVAVIANSGYGVGRTQPNKIDSVGTTIGRFKLSNNFDYSLVSPSNTPYFINLSSLLNYGQSLLASNTTSTSCLQWILHPSGYWINRVSASFSAMTDLSISSTTDNFVTLGMHLPSSSSTNEIHSFFYSFDNNEYTWSNLFQLGVNINFGGQIHFGVLGSNVDYLICDWIGIINPNIIKL